MAYVYENVTNNNTKNSISSEIGLGVKLSNLDSTFVTLYTVQQQAHENLKTLLLTRVGERYMQPNYGTRLLDIIFQPNTNELKPEIEDILVGPINFWLPYISIEEINIVTAEDDPTLMHQIQISIRYSINNFGENTITIFANNDNTLSVV